MSPRTARLVDDAKDALSIDDYFERLSRLSLELDVERTHAGVTVSAMVAGYFERRRYIGYSVAECRAMFVDEMVGRS